jgi:fused signal recognition particle receptor
MELVIVLGILVLLALGAFAAVSVTKRSQRRMDGAERSAITRPKATPKPTPEPGDVEIVLPPGEDVVVPDEVEIEAEPAVEELPARPRLRDRLGKARALLSGYFGDLRSRSVIDDEVWDELEEALIRADVGVTVTGKILDDLRVRVKEASVTTPAELLDLLKADLIDQLSTADRTLTFTPGQPNVWMFVGVNGVGKTTSIGKIALREAGSGRSVVMAAADTFRAAAAE